MDQTQTLIFGALLVALGFALAKAGTGLVRVYERAIQANPRKVMSWDVLGAIITGPWSLALTIGAALIASGYAALIAGGLLIVLGSFPFFV